MSEIRTRIAWLDVARGGAILLVIVWHSYLAADTIGPVQPAIQILNQKLTTVRMPLFFFCSGILAFWGLNRSWKTVLSGRVWTMIWIYLVWSTLTLVMDQFYATSPWHAEPQRLSGFLWLPYGNQWFVYALILVTLFARAMFHLSLAAQIALVGAAQLGLSLWSPRFEGYTTNIEHLVAIMASYGLVFFMLGLWLAGTVLRMFNDDRRSVIGLLAGLGLWTAIYLTEEAMSIQVPAKLEAACGVVAALAFASIISRVRSVRQPLQWVGQRTLEIFVCHQFIVGLATLACLRAGVSPSLSFVAITAATCATAISLAWITSTAGPRLLFRPPKFSDWIRRPDLVRSGDAA